MPLKAIVVDDEQLIRELLRHVLEIRGYKVMTYAQPDLCPFYDEAECPCPDAARCADLLITDVNMPGCTGIEFVERLIRADCKIPNIAIMSGSWTVTERTRAEATGCAIFEKPLRMSDLEAWLESCEQRMRADSLVTSH